MSDLRKAAQAALVVDGESGMVQTNKDSALRLAREALHEILDPTKSRLGPHDCGDFARWHGALEACRAALAQPEATTERDALAEELRVERLNHGYLREEFDELHTGAVERLRQLQATIKERDALLQHVDTALAVAKTAEAKTKKCEQERDALRELMNCYNLGGWTDAERLQTERDQARAECDALRLDANTVRIELLVQLHSMMDIADQYARLMHKRGDADERDRIQGAIEHSRKKSAPFNYNGPWQDAAIDAAMKEKP